MLAAVLIALWVVIVGAGLLHQWHGGVLAERTLAAPLRVRHHAGRARARRWEA